MINAAILQCLDNFASGFQIIHGNHDEPLNGQGWDGNEDGDDDYMVEEDYFPFPHDI